MKLRKIMVALAVFTIFGNITAYAGEIGPGVTGKWHQSEENGKWYYLRPNGTYPASQWEQINDIWYYFDSEGYMKTGWIDDNGVRYWTDESGAMAENIQLVIDGREYVFDENGACQNSYKMPTAIPPEEEKSELHHTVDAMADNILAQITNDTMTKTQKARAIYSWIRSNIRYVSSSQKGDWVLAAYNGFRKRSGDCYTYYSVALALLNRADIPSIEVTRLDGNHWWNLINCGEGWYHFDTCPRSSGASFCLLTDNQLISYSNHYITGSYPYGSHGFDTSLYPATPN